MRRLPCTSMSPRAFASASRVFASAPRAVASVSVAEAGAENNPAAATDSVTAAIDRRHRRFSAFQSLITFRTTCHLTGRNRIACAGRKNVGGKVSCGLKR